MINVRLVVPMRACLTLRRGDVRPACATRTFSATYARCLAVPSGTFGLLGDGGEGFCREWAKGPLKRGPRL